MTNEELVRKATIHVNDLAAAGKLNDKQSDEFLDYVIDVTELTDSARIVRFRNENMDIDKIGVGARVSVPKSEAKDPNVRRGVTTSKITLTPKEIMTPFQIGDNFGEHNIEGPDKIEQTILRLMGTATANDLEELAINGDVLGPARIEADLLEGGDTSKYVKDTFISLFDGWLRQMDSANIYDAAGANTSTAVFSQMIKKMPVKFRRTRRNLRFLMSHDQEQTWREKVASRGTMVGDRALTESNRINVFGIPMVPVPLLEQEPRITEHITLSSHPSSVTLRYKPIGTSVVITPSTLDKIATAPYTEGSGDDYEVNRTTGVVSTTASGAVVSGTFKVTYESRAQIALTEYNNLIFAIGRAVSIERDRDIYAGLNLFSITTKIDAEVEELTACVKGINIGLD